MSLRSRLSKLSPVLTARERALLLLRCLKEDRDEDDSIRWGMPNSQVRELNQYVGLMNSANRDLGALCRVLTIEVEGLEHRREWYQVLLDWQATAGEAASLVDVLRDELKRTLLAHLSHRWQELRALEVVWAEIAEEFGEDPVHSSYRNEVALNKAAIQRMASVLRRKPSLAEPSDEMLEATRDLVRRAKEFVT